MPYPSNQSLPLSVRRHLPSAAQSIYREAFNHAWLTYSGSARREEIAHRVAWSAVKRCYRKAVGGAWEPAAAEAGSA